MPATERKNRPGDQKGPIVPAIIGQLLALILALILFWLHSGGDFSDLGTPLDAGYLLVAASWLVVWVLLVFRISRKDESRPHLAFWLALAPALLAIIAAWGYSGLMPRMTGGNEDCELLLANAFWGERLQFTGLLASGSMCWGLVITQMLLPSRPEAGSPEPGKESAKWPWAAAAVLFTAAVVWSFLDPVMPSRAKVGGPEVRGLWVLVAGAVVLWAWARFLPMLSNQDAVGRALRGSLAAILGLLMIGCALVAYHRFSTFRGLAYEADRFQWGENDAAAVTATALVRIAPAVLVAILVSLVAGLRRMGTAGRKWSLVLVGVLLAGSGLYWGYEADWRSSYAGQCGSDLPPGLVLPATRASRDPREGSLLVVDRHNAWLDGSHVIESEPVELNPAPSAFRGEPLNLAVDRRVRFGRLHAFLKAAGKVGWHRFRLLVREPSDSGCERERRVFGVCLSEHISNLSANQFEIPHFARHPARPANPPEGVVANVIVEPGQMEVSFGGFGVSGEGLGTMSSRLPDRMGVRNLTGLVQVLTRAKERFPSSRRLILVLHDDLPVEELADLIAAVHGEKPPRLFPDLTVSRLTR